MRPIITLIAVPIMFAQSYETSLGTQTAEIMGGVVYRNVDGGVYNAVGTRILGGLNRWVSLYGEYSYSRLLSETFYADPLQGVCRCSVEERYRGSIMDFEGGGKLHLSGHRLQPYLLGGVGSVRISAKAVIGAFKETASDYRFASSVGGGVHIFATRNFGFSAEAKTVAVHDSSRFERYTVGLFYQHPARR